MAVAAMLPPHDGPALLQRPAADRKSERHQLEQQLVKAAASDAGRRAVSCRTLVRVSFAPVCTTACWSGAAHASHAPTTPQTLAARLKSQTAWFLLLAAGYCLAGHVDLELPDGVTGQDDRGIRPATIRLLETGLCTFETPYFRYCAVT
jgi:hypothetical protein